MSLWESKLFLVKMQNMESIQEHAYRIMSIV